MKEVTKGHLAIFGVNLIFGFNVLIAKTALGENGIDPLILTFLRMVGAMLAFWIASFFVKSEKLTKRDYITMFLASLIGISINQLSFTVGLSTTSPVDASIIITLTPIITMIISAFYLKEPVTIKKSLGVLIGFAGVMLLIFTGAEIITAGRTWVGNLLCLLSALSYAFYLILFRDFIKRFHPITLMKWMFLFATIIITPITYNKISTMNYSAISFDIWACVGYVVFMATFVTYFLIRIGQVRLRPTTLTMYNYLQPVIAALVAVWVGMESFSWYKVIAAVLVFVGVYIVTNSKSKVQIDSIKSNKASN